MTGRPLVVVLGPTAVGKTGFAIELARAVNGEIVSADSRQVYRHMDIGTAKPTPEQCAHVVHHLINIVNPDETLGLAQYQRLAYDAIDAIHRRDRIPLLVGGTGQYLTAVIEGWSIPEVAPNPALRAELEAFAAAHGSDALHRRLAELDPIAARRIHHRNVRRVVRALEVSLGAALPISELQRKRPPPYAIFQLGLTLPREKLCARADARLDQMMADGFLAEVNQLLAMGYSRDLPSMSGLGYRQLTAHVLDGLPLLRAIDATRVATRDFIRRQYTWFNGHDRGILWHNIEETRSDRLVSICTDWLRQLD